MEPCLFGSPKAKSIVSGYLYTPEKDMVVYSRINMVVYSRKRYGYILPIIFGLEIENANNIFGDSISIFYGRKDHSSPLNISNIDFIRQIFSRKYSPNRACSGSGDAQSAKPTQAQSAWRPECYGIFCPCGWCLSKLPNCIWLAPPTVWIFKRLPAITLCAIRFGALRTHPRGHFTEA